MSLADAPPHARMPVESRTLQGLGYSNAIANAASQAQALGGPSAQAFSSAVASE